MNKQLQNDLARAVQLLKDCTEAPTQAFADKQDWEWYLDDMARINRLDRHLFSLSIETILDRAERKQASNAKASGMRLNRASVTAWRARIRDEALANWDAEHPLPTIPSEFV
jgi:hypothetical protein